MKLFITIKLIKQKEHTYIDIYIYSQTYKSRTLKCFLLFQNLLFEENNEVNDKMQFVFSFFAPSYETRILSKYNNLNG